MNVYNFIRCDSIRRIKPCPGAPADLVIASSVYICLFNTLSKIDKAIICKNNELEYLEKRNVLREVGLRVGLYGSTILSTWIAISSIVGGIVLRKPKIALCGFSLSCLMMISSVLEFVPRIEMGRRDS